MCKIIDLTGRKIGQLTVLGQAGRDRQNAITWFCHCAECGSDKAIRGSYLTSKKPPMTCGCGRGGTGQWMNKINLGKRYEFEKIPYRSRYEVLVAMSLTLIQCDFQYEPQHFVLKVNGRYTPDFLVRNCKWLEVKGDTTGDNLAKFNEFAEDHNSQLIASPEIGVLLGSNVQRWYYHWKKNGYTNEYAYEYLKNSIYRDRQLIETLLA